MHATEALLGVAAVAGVVGLVLAVAKARRRWLVPASAIVLVAVLAGGATLLLPHSSAGARASASATPHGRASDVPRGRVESVVIPGLRSHFRARNAVVYLPPAAVDGAARDLPVVLALSGEPGKPSDITVQGHLEATMDEIAAAHRGIAPIVVVPDQLGATHRNPMCVDSKLGNVATYLTVDVPTWIRAVLPVSRDRHEWTIAGFSEGGTCAIQLGAAHPSLFGSIADISGELAPRNGSVAHTIAVGFGGSRARYAQAAPLALLAAHRYADERAVFAVGALDRHYGPVEPVVAAHAKAAGMRVTFRRIPGGHNWTMARQALAWSMQQLVPLWRLPAG